MGKVYIVTDGAYSDMSVECVFTDMEMATEYRNQCFPIDGAVMEVELDHCKLPLEKGHLLFQLTLADDMVCYAVPCSALRPDPVLKPGYGFYYKAEYFDTMEIKVAASTYEEAVKKAIQIRENAKANGKWKPAGGSKKNYRRRFV
jgi:hypothetical protein